MYALLNNHLTLFPSEKSHYKSQRTGLRYFTNPNLTRKKLYRLFKQYYQEKTGDELSMAYNTYCMIFKKKTKYAFRKPRVDVCDFCRRNEMLLKVNLENKKIKTDLALHLKRVESYKTIKKYSTSNGGNDVMCAFEFDYSQNLPLPKLNVTTQFYKRLL